MHKLYVIRGVPGSGKSTLALELAQAFNTTHIEADQFFVNEDGVYKWEPEKIHKAHVWCQGRVRARMYSGFPVIILSNTSTTENEVKPYLDMAKDYGYSVTSIVVENRHGNTSVHAVPVETIEKMKTRFSVKL